MSDDMFADPVFLNFLRVFRIVVRKLNCRLTSRYLLTDVM